MPIEKINSQRIFVYCPVCEHRRNIQIGSLELGTAHNPDGIQLPPCQCGSVETLFRTWDTMPNAPLNHHRRAVNALAGKLKGQGRTNQKHASRFAVEQGAPPDNMSIDSEVDIAFVKPKQRRAR